MICYMRNASSEGGAPSADAPSTSASNADTSSTIKSMAYAPITNANNTNTNTDQESGASTIKISTTLFASLGILILSFY